MTARSGLLANVQALEATEKQWDGARRRTMRVAVISTVIGGLGIPLLVMPAMLLADSMLKSDWRYLAAAGWLALLSLPLVVAISFANDYQMRRSNRMVRDLLRSATEEAKKQQAQADRKGFESRLSGGLDMAQAENEVVNVIERALGEALPSAPVELLLADNSHAHLLRVAFSSPDGAPPACPVDSPAACPAARRGQTQYFSDSTALDACPKLQGRSQGPCSAVCSPVAIMGQTVGVVHAVAEVGKRPSDTEIADLRTLANLAGARLGMLRKVADAELQASTDNLTGLLNRRVFEREFTRLRASDPTMTLAMADLDHFKALNDSHGHETGDRALVLFSRALKENVRLMDLVSRHGGEEFVIAFPGSTPADAALILDTVRLALREASSSAGLPAFTSSFGVIRVGPGEDLQSALRRADSALFDAKQAGRDRVIVHAGDSQAVAR